MDDAFAPLFAGERLVPRWPHAAMPPDEQRLWEHFSRRLGWGDRLHARITFDFLLQVRAFARGKPVLDAGAGHQRYRPFFDDAVYLTQEHPGGIEFKQMQGIGYDLVSPIDERIPLKDGSLAAVVSTSVLEHVRWPERFLAEAQRVLHPGGRLYIHVPFAHDEHEVPYDFQRPTRYGLAAWLQAAGFAHVSVQPSSNSSYGASAYLMTAVQREMLARGQGQRLADVAPVLKYCLDLVNGATDDAVDAATAMPVGWVAVAQKAGALGEFPRWSRDEWLQHIKA